jgi:alpha-L-rhamnosidase
MASGLQKDDKAPLDERLHPEPLIRQTFQLPAVPDRGRLYITAHGLYDVRINGEAVSDEIFAPGHDEHPRRLSVQTYDVTSVLRPGDNVIAITLSDGYWAGRTSFTGESANYGDRLAVTWQLEGDRKVVAVSDGSARSSFGPIRYADIYIGEKYDARKTSPGWTTTDFDASAWSLVNVVGRSTEGLVPFIGEPIRRLLALRPAAILKTPAGETVIDLGQNIAGRIRLRARGLAGTEIRFEHTEALDRNGNFQTNIIGKNKDQTDIWILSGNGDGEEEFEPTFTYHGFRYVRVTNYPGELTADKVTAFAIGSDLAQVGAFETDHAGINRLHENVVWSQRSNFFSIPTDGPQRERAGWTGDAQFFVGASTNNMHVHQFWARWLANVRAAQLSNGAIPHIVPNTPSFSRAMAFLGPAAAAWGDAITVIPVVLFERYGDLQVLRENYAAMRAWHGYVRGIAESERPERYAESDGEVRERQPYLWNTGFQFGDWLAPSFSGHFGAAQATGEFVASACYFRSTNLLARVATLLGDAEAARNYAALAERIMAAFQAEFIAPDGRLSLHYQGAYVLALAYDLVPVSQRGLAGRLLADLVVEADYHLDTGFVSLPFLLDVLVDVGRKDLAYRILLQDSPPSWLYQVKMGATTIWEDWRSVEEDGQPRNMSRNHYAPGAVDDWLFRRVAGITALSPGYKEILIQPDLDAPFEHFRARIATPNGPVSVAVDTVAGARRIVIDAPPNATTHLQVGQERKRLRTGRNEFVL